PVLGFDGKRIDRTPRSHKRWRRPRNAIGGDDVAARSPVEPAKADNVSGLRLVQLGLALALDGEYPGNPFGASVRQRHLFAVGDAARHYAHQSLSACLACMAGLQHES